MKIRVCYTVNVNKDYRRAINAYYGREGLATREEVVQFCKLNGQTLDDDLMSEYKTSLERLDASLTK
jgi:hypothetical protein